MFAKKNRKTGSRRIPSQISQVESQQKKFCLKVQHVQSLQKFLKKKSLDSKKSKISYRQTKKSLSRATKSKGVPKLKKNKYSLNQVKMVENSLSSCLIYLRQLLELQDKILTQLKYQGYKSFLNQIKFKNKKSRHYEESQTHINIHQNQWDNELEGIIYKYRIARNQYIIDKTQPQPNVVKQQAKRRPILQSNKKFK